MAPSQRREGMTLRASSGLMHRNKKSSRTHQTRWYPLRVNLSLMRSILVGSDTCAIGDALSWLTLRVSICGLSDTRKSLA
jgi:hypothetical protein